MVPPAPWPGRGGGRQLLRALRVTGAWTSSRTAGFPRGSIPVVAGRGCVVFSAPGLELTGGVASGCRFREREKPT